MDGASLDDGGFSGAENRVCSGVFGGEWCRTSYTCHVRIQLSTNVGSYAYCGGCRFSSLARTWRCDTRHIQATPLLSLPEGFQPTHQPAWRARSRRTRVVRLYPWCTPASEIVRRWWYRYRRCCRYTRPPRPQRKVVIIASGRCTVVHCCRAPGHRRVIVAQRRLRDWRQHRWVLDVGIEWDHKRYERR